MPGSAPALTTMRKPVLDHGTILTVHRVVTGGDAARRLRPGEARASVSTWCYRNGEEAGSVSHRVELSAEDAGTMLLEYRIGDRLVRQAFDVVGRPCRFGGYRWLARCPRSGRLVAKLYACGGPFQPRRSIDAAYRSQDRVPATERLRDREVTILRRLQADDSSPLEPPKPKWMRRHTYARLIRELRTVRYAHGLSVAQRVYRATGMDLTGGRLTAAGR